MFPNLGPDFPGISQALAAEVEAGPGLLGRMFRNFLECCGMFPGMFWNVVECSLECSGMFGYETFCFGMFRAFSGSYGIMCISRQPLKKNPL